MRLMRMSQDFSKGKIYKITNDYNDDVYVGSTCDTLVKRFSKHKCDMNNSVKMNSPLYKLMREIGIDRFAIYLIEEYPCDTKYELRQREGHHIRQIGTLNIYIAGRDDKEHYEDNRENKLKYQREYYNKNTTKVLDYHKDYYQNNKEKIYDNYKKKIEEKLKCECGRQVSLYCLAKHKTTKIHLERMKSLNPSTII